MAPTVGADAPFRKTYILEHLFSDWRPQPACLTHPIRGAVQKKLPSAFLQKKTASFAWCCIFQSARAPRPDTPHVPGHQEKVLGRNNFLVLGGHRYTNLLYFLELRSRRGGGGGGGGRGGGEGCRARAERERGTVMCMVCRADDAARLAEAPQQG